MITLLEKNRELNYPIEIRIFIRGDLPQNAIMKFPDFKKIASYRCKIIFTYFYDDWGGVVRQDDLQNEMRLLPPINKNGPCKLLAFYPKVLVNGTITACGCRDYNGDSELILGNIKENSLFEIWSNGKLVNIYNRFKNKNYPDICKNCNQYRSIKYYFSSKSGRRGIADIQKRIKKSDLFKKYV